MGKLRVTRHNGRSGKNGIFKAGHNDRSFNIDNAEHIDEQRSWFNVYWDCYQGFNVSDKDGNRPERKYNFEEIEMAYYYEKFGDSIDAQNDRHTKSRHTERIRDVKQIYENEKTCPEETVYQIGTRDGAADPEIFVKVVTELFSELQDRFGSNFQILDWALHMDEETPHIHERHVFFADDGYGMQFPKQDKACEELGFERPNPDKKAGKNNNRKMSFDEEVRKIYIGIAEKHGIVIEKIPLEGKKHLEKNDLIIARQQEEIKSQQERLDEITMKISDVEELLDEVAATAYEKACEVVADTVSEETMKEDIGLVEEYRDKMVELSDTPAKKSFAKKILNSLINVFADRGKQLVANVKKALMAPEIRKRNEEEIKTATRTSIHERLRQAQAELKEKETRKVPMKNVQTKRQTEEL
jgi:hypothetical protein